MGLEPMGYTAANRRTIKLMVEQAAPLFEDGSAPMFMNMATAIIEVAVGKLFYAIAPIGDPNAGKKRLFLRVNTAPYYEDQGDAAAPATQDFADSVKIRARLGTSGDQSSVLQAAINRQATGKRTIEIGEGTFSIKDVSIPSGTYLRGKGMEKTTIARAGSLTLGILTLAAGASDITISDMTIDGLSASDAQSLVRAASSIGSNIRLERVKFVNSAQRAAFRVDVSTTPFKNLVIRDCKFSNCPQGAIQVLTTVRGNDGVWIEKNYFEQCGSSIVSVHDYDDGTNNTDTRWNCNFNVFVRGNIITNCQNTGTYGPIPFEIWSWTGGECSGNMIDSGTRGLSAGANMQGVAIHSNYVANQTFYGCEMGVMRDCQVHNNIFVNCVSAITFSGLGAIANGEASNIDIFDNLIYGTGLTAYGTTDIITSGGGGGGLPVLRGVRIKRNRIVNAEFARNCIRVTASQGYAQILFSGGGGSGASATATYKAVAGRVLRGGSGYTSAPTVTALGGGGSGMTLTATVASGKITAITVTNAGTGYISSPELRLSGGGGKGALVEAALGLEAITVTAGGSGYTSAPTVTIQNHGGAATATATATLSGGAVSSVTITAPGTGFGRGSDVEIDDNVIIADTYDSPASAINAYGQNVRVRGNRYTRRGAWDTSHYQYSSALAFGTTAHTINQNNPQIIFAENVVEQLGTIISGNPIEGFIDFNPTAAHYGLALRRNVLIGTFRYGLVLNDSSSDAVVEDMDFSRATLTAINPILTTNSPYVRVTKRWSASTIPTTGSFRKGDFVENSNPSIASGKVLLGWMRLTTGSAHISGTDWSPIYGTTT